MRFEIFLGTTFLTFLGDPPQDENYFKMVPKGCNGTVHPEKENVMNHGELR